ncbi:unnamed protein product, partial [Rotaria sordida]
SDNQKRLFIELDFAEEQNIEDYYYFKQDQREYITQQMNKYSDIIEKESIKLQSMETFESQIRISSQTSDLIQMEDDKTKTMSDSKASILL